MKRALEIGVAASIAHVSRLRRVFGCARLRNVCRRSGGRSMVRKGAPDSAVAVDLNVYFDEAVGGICWFVPGGCSCCFGGNAGRGES